MRWRRQPAPEDCTAEKRTALFLIEGVLIKTNLYKQGNNGVCRISKLQSIMIGSVLCGTRSAGGLFLRLFGFLLTMFEVDAHSRVGKEHLPTGWELRRPGRGRVRRLALWVSVLY